jgi:hypothetical protein
MSELVKQSAPPAESPAERVPSGPRKVRAQKALELVALKGRDVIGVRHLLEGGVAWVGQVADALARVPMSEFGGQPRIAGEVRGGSFLLHVPPRARARLHGADGLARIVAGPQKICLGEGDRAVLVLGPVQIRAQISTIEVVASGIGAVSGAAGWIAFVGAVYVAALALCAAFAPPPPAQLHRGAMTRLHQPFMTHLAAH